MPAAMRFVSHYISQVFGMSPAQPADRSYSLDRGLQQIAEADREEKRLCQPIELVAHTQSLSRISHPDVDNRRPHGLTTAQRYMKHLRFQLYDNRKLQSVFRERVLDTSCDRSLEKLRCSLVVEHLADNGLLSLHHCSHGPGECDGDHAHGSCSSSGVSSCGSSSTQAILRACLLTSPSSSCGVSSATSPPSSRPCASQSQPPQPTPAETCRNVNIKALIELWESRLAAAEAKRALYRSGNKSFSAKPLALTQLCRIQLHAMLTAFITRAVDNAESGASSNCVEQQTSAEMRSPVSVESPPSSLLSPNEEPSSPTKEPSSPNDEPLSQNEESSSHNDEFIARAADNADSWLTVSFESLSSLSSSSNEELSSSNDEPTSPRYRWATSSPCTAQPPAVPQFFQLHNLLSPNDESSYDESSSSNDESSSPNDEPSSPYVVQPPAVQQFFGSQNMLSVYHSMRTDQAAVWSPTKPEPKPLPPAFELQKPLPSVEEMMAMARAMVTVNPQQFVSFSTQGSMNMYRMPNPYEVSDDEEEQYPFGRTTIRPKRVR